MPVGGILSARGGDSKCPGHLESPPLALRVPLEVSTAFRYLQLTNQIARITSAIVETQIHFTTPAKTGALVSEYLLNLH